MIQIKNKSERRLLLTILMMTALFILTSCTASQQQKIYHGTYMKGSIIHATDARVYLCIGNKDGAKAGQELNVYKITYTGQPKKPAFNRNVVGKVKILEILDEHFASASIISGKADVNDVVELLN